MKNATKTLLTLLVALLSASAAHSQVYRWVDSNGVTIYSDAPPPSQATEATSIKLAPSPKASAEDSGKRAEEIIQKADEARERREEEKKKKEEEKADKERRKQNCANARANLDKLTALGRRLWKNPDGKYERLTEEKRQEMMETARKQIEENCD